MFPDANIPMYAAGRPHPLKAPCQHVMRALDRQPEAFVTDAEVLQEIIHRYLAVRRWEQGRRVFRSFAVAMAGRIESVLPSDVEGAAALADNYPTQLDARDLLHAAVMNRLGARRIVSTDAAFDRIQGIERLNPALVDEWA